MEAAETRTEPEQHQQDVLGQKQKPDGRRGDKIHVKLIKEHRNKKQMKIHPSEKHLSINLWQIIATFI